MLSDGTPIATLWTSSARIHWSRLRNAESQAPAQATGGGPQASESERAHHETLKTAGVTQMAQEVRLKHSNQGFS